MKKKLHIAIEAFPLSDDNLTGIGNVCKYLIEALYHIDKETKFTVLLKGGNEHLNIKNPNWDLIYSKKAKITVKRDELKSELIKCKKILLRLRFRFYWFLNALFFLGYMSIIPLKLWRFKVDVYIGLSPNFYPYYFVGKKIKRVALIHDLVWKLFPETMERSYRLKMVAFIHYNLKRTSFLLANSENTKKDFLEVFGPKKNIYVTPLAADKNLYKPAGKKKIDEIKSKYSIKGKYLISVCTLEPRKNLETLINTFALLKQHNYVLVLVGEIGWIDNSFFDNLDILMIREKVIITGYVAREDLPPLYSGAEVFVYPSLYEGFGLPVLEAMQCGCPVIASNNSSIPEVTGDAALLLDDPKNENEMLKAINKVLTDASLRRELCKKGLNRSKMFDWDKTAEIMMDVIRNECEK